MFRLRIKMLNAIAMLTKNNVKIVIYVQSTAAKHSSSNVVDYDIKLQLHQTAFTCKITNIKLLSLRRKRNQKQHSQVSQSIVKLHSEAR